MPEQHPSMFDVQSVDLSVIKDILVRTNSLEALKELEKERNSLIHLTDLVNQELYKITIESKCTYDERRLLYFSIQNPDFTIEKAAVSLGMNESDVHALFDTLHRRGLIK